LFEQKETERTKMMLNTKTQEEIALDEVRAADRRLALLADQAGSEPRIAAVSVERSWLGGRMMPQMEIFIIAIQRGGGLLSLSLHVFGQN
jgi:hypothetical protein